MSLCTYTSVECFTLPACNVALWLDCKKKLEKIRGKTYKGCCNNNVLFWRVYAACGAYMGTIWS